MGTAESSNKDLETRENSGKPVLLIVDDVPANIKTLVSILSSECKILVATHGLAGLETAKSKHIDLILLDILMPEMDGFEVCKRLKAHAPTRHIPIIFITGLGEPESEKMGLELGAVDYITKPFNPAVVKVRVNNHLVLQATLRQLERQNKALSDAEKLRVQVEQITRHDMKSPLNGIIGFTELLLEDDDISEENKKSLMIIRQDAYRSLHMINLSLGLYRMEQGIYDLKPGDVDLIAVLKNVHQDMDGLIRTMKIDIIILVQERPARLDEHFIVWGEEILCYSVLANLIKNSVEASPRNATITITLREEESMNTVTIHNQGSVPESIRDRFFEKCVTHGKKMGTGLGTYSAKLITEAQGGSIELAPANELNETTLIVHLPRKPLNQA
ncbi:MAG: response regulator [Magnetococcus sp. DMHC-1]|nr:response regulator [Magnetococcales bacterium]